MFIAIVTATTLLLPTTPTSSDPVSTTVETINALRSNHGAPPLSLDSEVSRTAQERADHLQATNRFEHRPHNPYGENLYETSRNRSIDSAAADALKDWYREFHRYDYSEEMTQSNLDRSLLHFTAMVWKSSTRVGVGLAQGRNGTYVVVNFAERGNTLNHFGENVRPPAKPKASHPPDSRNAEGEPSLAKRAGGPRTQQAAAVRNRRAISPLPALAPISDCRGSGAEPQGKHAPETGRTQSSHLQSCDPQTTTRTSRHPQAAPRAPPTSQGRAQHPHRSPAVSVTALKPATTAENGGNPGLPPGTSPNHRTPPPSPRDGGNGTNVPNRCVKAPRARNRMRFTWEAESADSARNSHRSPRPTAGNTTTGPPSRRTDRKCCT